MSSAQERMPSPSLSKETLYGVRLEDPYRNLETFEPITVGRVFSANEASSHLTSGVTTRELLRKLSGKISANDSPEDESLMTGTIAYDAFAPEGIRITRVDEEASLEFIHETVIRLQRKAYAEWAKKLNMGNAEEVIRDIIAGNSFMHREEVSRAKRNYPYLVDEADSERIHYLNAETYSPEVNYHSLVENVERYLSKNVARDEETGAIVLREGDMKNLLVECGIDSPACLSIIGGVLADLQEIIALANDEKTLQEYDSASPDEKHQDSDGFYVPNLKGEVSENSFSKAV